MLSILLSSTLLLGGALAGITDLNCTDSSSGTPKYAPSAVNCKNKLSDDNCIVLYTTAVKVNDDTTDRDAKCAGNPVVPQLVQAAVDLCPKTCGYCCLTPAFACDDKLQPRIPCASVTEDMCTNAAWKSILEEDCPKTCGLCDSAPGCKISGSVICHSKNLEAFAKRYCKKTCGYCKDSTGMAPGTVICGSNRNCVNWIRNGFCTSTYYTQEYKMRYCGRECGLC